MVTTRMNSKETEPNCCELRNQCSQIVDEICPLHTYQFGAAKRKLHSTSTIMHFKRVLRKVKMSISAARVEF